MTKTEDTGDMPDIDVSKVDNCTLALLYLVRTGPAADDGSIRAWKGFDWDTMNRLHEQGWISDPVTRNKSVWLTPEGVRRAEALFRQLFGKGE